MRRSIVGRLAAVALVMSSHAVLAASPVPTPSALREWEPWVLRDTPAHRCPWLAPGNPADENQHVCAWPGPLELAVDGQGGHFSQHWRVDAESWIALPGDPAHWPEHVTLDGGAAALVEHDGTPSLRVPPGTHAIAGEFRWAQRPELLAVPGSVALVALSVGGSRIAAPQRTVQGLFLGHRAAVREEDRLDLRVFRRLTDEQPARLLTHLALSIAGEAREIRLPDVLPPGFVPSSIDSPLAARLDPDHALRLQVRPGRFVVEIDARGPSPVSSVSGSARPTPWPAQETWSFAAVDRLRVAVVEGAPAVDPAAADVPDDWRELPAYVVSPGSTLKVSERSRGLTAADGNQLLMRRLVWLDFSGDAYTVQDQISGTMRHDWRLDLAAPYVLQSARSGDTPLLVTQGAKAGTSGIEWRSPQVDATTVARVPRGFGSLPATGWQQRFEQASGTLMLAPAYRLIAALGPDAAPGAWLERWHLLDVFVVLLTAVTTWRLYGWRLALLALAALTLTHHEPDAPTWLWLNALAALALARSAPEGRLRHVASVYRIIALAAVAVMLVPFAITQVRLAVYPQLEAAGGAIPVAVSVREAALRTADVPMGRLQSTPPDFVPPPPSAAPAPLQSGTPEVPDFKPVPEARKVEEAVLSGERRATAYEPGAVTQSGPGLPQWRYMVYPFSWSGPVEAQETVRFIISPPWLTRLWRVVGTALSLALLVLLLPARRDLLANGLRGGATVAIAVIAAGAASLALPSPADASTTPDPSVLKELQDHLMAPPTCGTTCVDIASASVDATPGQVSVTLGASALDNVGLALPTGDPDWVIERVEVDGVAATGVHRDAAGRRYVPLAPGHHLVRIEGSIAEVDALSIRFPTRPHVIDVSPGVWDVGGVAERRLLGDALELSRRRVITSSVGPTASKAEFPPYVIVERNIHLGHDWQVQTRVRRIAPTSGAFTARVPLLPAESPVTAGLAVADRVVSVGFAATDDERTYSSTLVPAAAMDLVATRDASFGEVWRFDVAPSWHAEFSGVPAIRPADATDDAPDDGIWHFEYAPRAGEHLTVRVTRPAAIPGGSLAFDRVALATSIGARARSTELNLAYRSTQGGRTVLRVPADARVVALTADGESLGIRPENGALSLPLLPGAHTVELRWDQASGPGWITSTPAVDAGAPASNLNIGLTMPEDRWVLYAWGPGIGPAVLYWGELLVFLVVAFVAGRSGRTPLGTRDWLLLGLGLSTYSWVALAAFAVFIVVFEWRRQQPGAVASTTHFNLMQVALAVLAVAAIAGLVAAVPVSLLSTPDMRVAGAYQPPGTYQWFSDQTASAVPVAAILSVPLWWYKLAMLVWALWLSFALTGWVRWAWDIFRRDGLWQALEHHRPGKARTEPQPAEAGDPVAPPADDPADQGEP